MISHIFGFNFLCIISSFGIVFQIVENQNANEKMPMECNQAKNLVNLSFDSLFIVFESLM